MEGLTYRKRAPEGARGRLHTPTPFVVKQVIRLPHLSGPHWEHPEPRQRLDGVRTVVVQSPVLSTLRGTCRTPSTPLDSDVSGSDSPCPRGRHKIPVPVPSGVTGVWGDILESPTPSDTSHPTWVFRPVLFLCTVGPLPWGGVGPLGIVGGLELSPTRDIVMGSLKSVGRAVFYRSVRLTYYFLSTKVVGATPPHLIPLSKPPAISPSLGGRYTNTTTGALHTHTVLSLGM